MYDFEDIVNLCWEEIEDSEEIVSLDEVSKDVLRYRLNEIYKDLEDEGMYNKDEQLWEIIGDYSVIDLYDLSLV